jgi:hypothetical protein
MQAVTIVLCDVSACAAVCNWDKKK